VKGLSHASDVRRTESPFALTPGERAFEQLYASRTLYLRGPLQDDVADTLVAQLLALDAASNETITLQINSPGGVITGMFAIYDTMQLLDSPVDTRCVGLAASAGAFLLACGTGERSASANSRIMIHQPLGGARGTARDIEIQAQNIVWMRERINEILAARCGQDLDRIRRDTDRDLWMCADDAVAYGLIDRVLTPVTGRSAHTGV
jgi:ATP-dependent Clp protease, protease subunit